VYDQHRSIDADLILLLGAVGNADDAALSTLYNRTSPKLYGICLRLLPREADAQEVLQDTYLAVWHKAITYDASKAGPITWLAAIARNRAIDRLRANNRLRRRHHMAASLDEAHDVPDHAPAALDVLEAKQEHERVAKCLLDLDIRQQAMIRAAFFDGATYSDLAKREAMPIGTMKSLIRRGLLRMRRSLMDEYAVEHGCSSLLKL
jgi:RNA polymerase sigma-70 factor (ECF subfamily)